MSKTKKKSISTPNDVTAQGQDSLTGLFARIFWSLAGNILLVLILVKIFQKKTFISTFDLLFWILVILLILVRYCDIKYLKGVTSMGTPANLDDWRNYVKYLVILTSVIWISAKLYVFITR
jgi:hypothetical protein